MLEAMRQAAQDHDFHGRLDCPDFCVRCGFHRQLHKAQSNVVEPATTEPDAKESGA